MTKNNFMARIFFYMMLGLVISGLTSYFISQNDIVMSFLLTIPGIAAIIIIVVLEFFLVSKISKARDVRMTSNPFLTFVTFSIVNGIILSFLFLSYEIKTIYIVLLITAGLFGVLALLSVLIKKDLSSGLYFIYMLLSGYISLQVISFFIPINFLGIFLSILGLIIFSGLTVLYAQKLKTEYTQIEKRPILEQKERCLVCALEFYLLFLNIFLSILDLVNYSKKRRK